MVSAIPTINSMTPTSEEQVLTRHGGFWSAKLPKEKSQHKEQMTGFSTLDVVHCEIYKCF